MSKASKSGSDSEEDQDWKIRCICEFEHDDGNTIQCDKCKVWQHIACINDLDPKNLPEVYKCEKCNPRQLNVDRAKKIQGRKRVRGEIVDEDDDEDDVDDDDDEDDEPEDDGDDEVDISREKKILEFVKNKAHDPEDRWGALRQIQPLLFAPLFDVAVPPTSVVDPDDPAEGYTYENGLDKELANLVKSEESSKATIFTDATALKAGKAVNGQEHGAVPKQMHIEKIAATNLGIPPLGDVKHNRVIIDEPCQKDCVIAVYYGYMADRDDFLAKFQDKEDRAFTSAPVPYILVNMSKGLLVDARETRPGAGSTKLGKARFIRESCLPNAEALLFLVNDRPVIGLVALRDIVAGEEITVAHNYEPANLNYCVPCACGSPDTCAVFKGNAEKIAAGKCKYVLECATDLLERRLNRGQRQQGATGSAAGSRSAIRRKHKQPKGARRKPGRPPKDRSKQTESASAARNSTDADAASEQQSVKDDGTNSETTAAPKRRGRPPGTGYVQRQMAAAKEAAESRGEDAATKDSGTSNGGNERMETDEASLDAPDMPPAVSSRRRTKSSAGEPQDVDSQAAKRRAVEDGDGQPTAGTASQRSSIRRSSVRESPPGFSDDGKPLSREERKMQMYMRQFEQLEQIDDGTGTGGRQKSARRQSTATTPGTEAAAGRKGSVVDSGQKPKGRPSTGRPPKKGRKGSTTATPRTDSVIDEEDEGDTWDNEEQLSELGESKLVDYFHSYGRKMFVMMYMESSNGGVDNDPTAVNDNERKGSNGSFDSGHGLDSVIEPIKFRVKFMSDEEFLSSKDPKQDQDGTEAKPAMVKSEENVDAMTVDKVEEKRAAVGGAGAMDVVDENTGDETTMNTDWRRRQSGDSDSMVDVTTVGNEGKKWGRVLETPPQTPKTTNPPSAEATVAAANAKLREEAAQTKSSTPASAGKEAVARTVSGDVEKDSAAASSVGQGQPKKTRVSMSEFRRRLSSSDKPPSTDGGHSTKDGGTGGGGNEDKEKSAATNAAGNPSPTLMRLSVRREGSATKTGDETKSATTPDEKEPDSAPAVSESAQSTPQVVSDTPQAESTSTPANDLRPAGSPRPSAGHNVTLPPSPRAVEAVMNAGGGHGDTPRVPLDGQGNVFTFATPASAASRPKADAAAADERKDDMPPPPPPASKGTASEEQSAGAPEGAEDDNVATDDPQPATESAPPPAATAGDVKAEGQ